MAHDVVEEALRDARLQSFKPFVPEGGQGLSRHLWVLDQVHGRAAAAVGHLDDPFLHQHPQLLGRHGDLVPLPAQVILILGSAFLLYLQGPGHDVADLGVGGEEAEELLSLCHLVHHVSFPSGGTGRASRRRLS